METMSVYLRQEKDGRFATYGPFEVPGFCRGGLTIHEIVRIEKLIEDIVPGWYDVIAFDHATHSPLGVIDSVPMG